MPTSHTKHPETDERRLRSVATRAAIIKSASELFAAHAYSSTTLEAITTHAGVNKALVRYHFKSKQGLYSHILSEAISHGASLVRASQDGSTDPRQRLEAFINAISSLIQQRPHFAPIVTREWLSGGANIDPQVLQQLLVFYETHKQILEDGASQGVFRHVDAHNQHLSLVGALVFFTISDRMRRQRSDHMPSVPELAAYTAQVQHLFTKGLSPEAEPETKEPTP
ncbi:MAG: TetR/AcrR family transcriptional regulator [Planctomycetota bacterium]